MAEANKKFTFTNRYGEVIEAWKNGNGAVHFTHSNTGPSRVHEFNPFTATKLDVLLDSDDMRFLMQVYRSDA